jgi:biofilm PGA synthesis N-glycosyltransferase PgaC
VLGGHRAIFDPSARAYDTATESAEKEYSRKKRTLAGNYQLMAEMPEVLAPWRNPIWVQFVSHKVGRLAVPYCLIAMLVSNAFLLSGFYLATFLAQAIWYGLAITGWAISARAAFAGAAARTETSPSL